MAMLWLFLAFASTCVTFTFSYRYDDIVFLGVNCSSRDTCTVTNRPFFNTSCECDTKCRFYDDCCIDAEVPQNRMKSLQMTCLPLSNEDGVFVISKCKQFWNGEDSIRQKCENLTDFSDPLITVPATDTRSNLTYRNRYCALCNNVTNDLSTWSVTLNYNSLDTVNGTYGNITTEYILNNLVYENNSWGLNHWNYNQGRITFYPLDLMYDKPRYLSPNVRYCRPHLVSTCAPRWRRAEIRRKCHAYMAVIYINSIAYRNGHCAVCNDADFRIRLCEHGIWSRNRPSLSFSVLLDVNTSDGNQVGVSNNCPPNQKYDPFFKKCRNLGCALPGYSLRDGRCVRR